VVGAKDMRASSMLVLFIVNMILLFTFFSFYNDLPRIFSQFKDFIFIIVAGILIMFDLMAFWKY
jgi:hypothetical protein